MTGRALLWRVVAALFVLVNVGGAGYAAVLGEGMHATVHVAVLVAGYAAWRLTTRTRLQEPLAVPRDDERLENLQQSVDAIALEVERIGEAQRFSAKLQSERAQTPR